MLDQEDSINKGDRNKIYFLIVVILALLGTNAFLFFKDKKENERYITANTEKDRLKLEVEKIEVELDKVNALNVTLTNKLQEEQKLAREKIAELKVELQKGIMTQGDLLTAQKEVKQLREFVKNHSEEIVRLEKENYYLRSERDSLVKSASSVNKRLDELEKINNELDKKVKTGAALKADFIEVSAYRVKSSGKNIKVTRANTANKLNIKFSFISNQMAAKDYHRIYLRVFDPTGNLIANEADMFNADGTEMQYSSAINISYNDDDTVHNIDWVNPKEFIKGTYSIILYVDGFTTGKSSIELR
jgi:hypothetical protein